MANIRKQFNFRNGVQVDDDNLIVTSTGLVGIGTSIPNEALDVRGNAKVVGLLTATQLNAETLVVPQTTISNITLTGSIIGSGVSIRSGVVTAITTSGLVTYFGDGRFLQGLPTSQWQDVDVGLGFTSIYARGFVGVGTVDPRFVFQVAGTPDTSLAGFANGVGISSSGNILATGIVTASQFSGIGSNLTLINASNISSGTLNNDRLPQNINVSGILTASTSITSGNINASGIVTASSGLVAGNTTINGNLNATGIGTFGPLNATRLNVTGNVDVTGVGTFSGGIIGNVTGIASTARSLTGTPDILVNNITATSIAVTSIGATNINVTGIVTSQSLHIGTGGTAVSLSSNARLGIGSATPTKDLQILKSGEVILEITGSDKAQIILGQQKTTTSGIGNSTALIRFGDELKGFDLLNGDQGNFNYYLHAGSSSIAGIQTGNFRWFYGQNLSAPLMTLTFGGNLGIAKTNPDHKLHVVGTSTVTGNAFFGNDVSISGNLTVGAITLPSVISNTNLYNTSGISTFNRIEVTNDTTLSGNVIVSSAASVGLGTTQPIVSFDARNKDVLFGSIGINTSVSQGGLTVIGGGTFSSGVGIGTTSTSAYLGVYGNIEIYNAPGTQAVPINIFSGEILTNNKTTVGLGTTSARSALDFADVGKGFAGGTNAFMIVPRATNAERTLFGTGVGGIGTSPGAIIFNTTTNKFQGYTGIAWTDFH